MRTVRRTRCRLPRAETDRIAVRRIALVCIVLAAVLSGVASADAAPYVSCPGGYIADNLGDCPALVKHPVGGPRTGGGGSGGGGLLGDLLGRLGLGGLF